MADSPLERGAQANECRVPDGRTYGEVIAFEARSPQAANRFDRLIGQIAARCHPETCSDVADRILTAHRVSERRGTNVSLIDIAVAWERATRDGLADCTQTLATLMVMLE